MGYSGKKYILVKRVLGTGSFLLVRKIQNVKEELIARNKQTGSCLPDYQNQKLIERDLQDWANRAKYSN